MSCIRSRWPMCAAQDHVQVVHQANAPGALEPLVAHRSSRSQCRSVERRAAGAAAEGRLRAPERQSLFCLGCLGLRKAPPCHRPALHYVLRKTAHAPSLAPNVPDAAAAAAGEGGAATFDGPAAAGSGATGTGGSTVADAPGNNSLTRSFSCTAQNRFSVHPLPCACLPVCPPV